jgi:hypothetical protein
MKIPIKCGPAKRKSLGFAVKNIDYTSPDFVFRSLAWTTAAGPANPGDLPPKK